PRQDADAEGIALLAESLIACGLVQNLGGLRDEAGRVAIVFGGRRLRALQIAVETRPDLAMVPVRIAPDAMTAQAWASAENTARQDLNVVDEIRAYGAMAESGAAVA
ncbi:chromosome partitioning protein ParB, partial [Cereibacter changlensis]